MRNLYREIPKRTTLLSEFDTIITLKCAVNIWNFFPRISCGKYFRLLLGNAFVSIFSFV